jgi:pantothenate kinase
MATGGGAYKFYDRMRSVLHVDVVREDEMGCLIEGGLTFRILRGCTDRNRPGLLRH